MHLVHVKEDYVTDSGVDPAAYIARDGLAVLGIFLIGGGVDDNDSSLFNNWFNVSLVQNIYIRTKTTFDLSNEYVGHSKWCQGYCQWCKPSSCKNQFESDCKENQPNFC